MRNFKRILCTVLAFLLLVGAISIAFMETYFRTEYDSFQDVSERNKLAGTLDFLICGASHGYRAFDPAVIDPILGTNGYNISSALMTMSGRYEMLKTELERNPVKTVVLELSYNTMTRSRQREGTEGDLYVMAKLPGFSERLSYFFRGFYLSEYPDVYYKFVTEGMEAAVKLILGRKADHSTRSRGFLPAEGKSRELLTDYTERFHKTSLPGQHDPYNDEYFEKILKLCAEKNVRMILVTTPLSKDFLCQYDNFQYFYEEYCALAQKWNCDFYDFNLWKEKVDRFPDETRYYDTLHLNAEGAEEFSAVFAGILKRAEAGEDVRDEFYSNYAQMDLAVFFP